MSVEVNKGVLIIGLANTVLFGGEQTVELLLLDLGSGWDFSLPITDDQAEYLLTQVPFGDMLDIEEQGDPGEEEAADGTVDEAVLRERLDQIISSGPEETAAEGDSDAWTSTEATQQF